MEKLGNTSFAPTTRMELRRPHLGIHVRSTPKRTTSSFYSPIKFRREKTTHEKKGQHGSKHGIKDYYRPSKHTINRRLGEVQHSQQSPTLGRLGIPPRMTPLVFLID